MLASGKSTNVDRRISALDVRESDVDRRDLRVETGGTFARALTIVGLNATAILPDREKDLGPVRDGQFIAIAKRKGPSGPVLDALVMDKDDPRLQQFTRPSPT